MRVYSYTRHTLARLLPWIMAVVIVGVLIYLTYLLFVRDEGTINVTTTDLRNARNRWQSQNVAAYEMVVTRKTFRCLNYCGTWSLHVDSGSIDVLNYSLFDVPRAIPPDTHGDDLKFLTVDALFAEIEKALNEGDLKDNLYGYLLDYKVAFNEQLGYPSKFQYTGRPYRYEDGGSDLPYHTASSIEVNSLTVVRQR
ncbi:MAG: DUF6174 domain-containing protein [Chloroflexota bacterium]